MIALQSQFKLQQNMKKKGLGRLMKAVSDCSLRPMNTLLPAPSVSMQHGRGNFNICGGYKNLLDNDNDFNEQTDFTFKPRQQDFFSPGLCHETSELALPDRKLSNEVAESKNFDDFPLECQTPYGQRLVESEMRNFGLRKRSIDDFNPFGVESGWLFNEPGYHSARNFLVDGEMARKQMEEQCNDEDIGNRISTEISLSGPLARINLHENHEMPFDNQNQPSINPQLKSFWIENSSEMQPEANQIISEELGTNCSRQNTIDQSNEPLLSKTQSVAMELDEGVSQQSKQDQFTCSNNSEENKLVYLNFEEFNTGKGSRFPSYFAIPRQLQLYIENNPDEFMNNLGFPQEVCELLTETKMVKRIFAAGQKIGPLTREERKLKLMKYKEKRQHRTWYPKINYDSRKRVAETRMRQHGRFVSTRNANLKQENAA